MCIAEEKNKDKIKENPNELGCALAEEFMAYNYKYILGTFLAVYAHKYSNFDDIVNLNNYINEFNDKTVYDICSGIGIDLNDEDFSQKYPEVLSVMLGRGLLRDPYLIERIKEVKINGYDKLKEFHDIVLEGYKKVLYGDKAILFKMKELWGYMIDVFGLEEKEKYAKKIKKVQKLSEYEVLIHNIFTIATGW